MEISSINGANAQVRQMGINQATDSYSRNTPEPDCQCTKAVAGAFFQQRYDAGRKNDEAAGITAAD